MRNIYNIKRDCEPQVSTILKGNKRAKKSTLIELKHHGGKQ
jgi:hypothetical protein